MMDRIFGKGLRTKWRILAVAIVLLLAAQPGLAQANTEDPPLVPGGNLSSCSTSRFPARLVVIRNKSLLSKKFCTVLKRYGAAVAAFVHPWMHCPIKLFGNHNPVIANSTSIRDFDTLIWSRAMV